MNHDAPLSPRPLHHLSEARRPILTTRQLREHGVSPAVAAERSREGGPWQQLLPGVHLLHPGPPTGEERVRAALLYAASRQPSGPERTHPGRPDRAVDEGQAYGDVMVTGVAALALHGLDSAPPLRSLNHVDVLVPRSRRLRHAGFVRFVRAHQLPRAQRVAGVPAAPVARALADAAARLSEPAAARRLLADAVRAGRCEADAVVAELRRARLLGRPQLTDVVDALLAEGRAVAEGRLYDMVRLYSLPEPLWNVELRLPGGTHLAHVDAYWPDQAVAVEIEPEGIGEGGIGEGGAGAGWIGEGGGPAPDGAALPPVRPVAGVSGCVHRRGRLERLGIAVVPVSHRSLREAPESQAAVVRTALMASVDRAPTGQVLVTPR